MKRWEYAERSLSIGVSERVRLLTDMGKNGWELVTVFNNGNLDDLAFFKRPIESTRTFEEAWADKKKQGYQYGSDALEQARLGWEMREEEEKR